jgi:anhydro-N-acetylmuramic acid kinase
MEYKAVGLMSGTSGDGLDVALCRFGLEKGKWHYLIDFATTIPFPEDISQLLSNAHRLPGKELVRCDATFGAWCGEVVRMICRQQNFIPVFIASHGHTIFHEPKEGVCLQIGHAGNLAFQAGYPVVNDFRSADIAMGGEGAPLVPMGDHLLFPEFDYCLNIGGIANISFMKENHRVAWDIVPVNMVLNRLAQKLNLPFDHHGLLAASGSLIPDLLSSLDNIPFYHAPFPKSLAREWVEREIFPLLDRSDSVPDLLYTYTLHAARKISEAIQGERNKKVLVTGGGAWNRYLLQQLSSRTESEIVLPEKSIIDFKESMIFAFLGLLRWLEINNVLKSVTGASADHCAGSVTLP